MTTVRGRPPNFADIVKVLPAAARPGTIFTYGSTIYFDGHTDLPKPLLLHERIHMHQQEAFPGGPAAWWSHYLTHPGWRFQQELEAHIVEYLEVIRGGANRHMRRSARKQIAQRLSGPLYGRYGSLAKAEAYLREAEATVKAQNKADI